MAYRVCYSCGTKNVASEADCRECGKPLPKAQKAESVDTQCSWNDHGMRCWRRGVFSESTVGGGPWYCAEHERKRLGRPLRLVVAPVDNLGGYGLEKRSDEDSRAFAARCSAYLKEELAKFGDPSRINKDWARKILDRYVDGESVASVALEMACEALHKNLDDIRALRAAA